MKEKLLRAIDKNSKLSPVDLSKMFGVSEEEIVKTIKELEEEKVICGYPTLINWEKVEQDERVTAIIEVKVTPQRGQGFDRIAERIYKFDEVADVYLISGNYDLVVILEGKSMREIANFVSDKLSPLEAVLSTSTNFVLKKYKEDGLMFEQPLKDERQVILA